MLAAHLRLGHLTAIVDRNYLQQGGCTEETVALDDLAGKFSAFGWRVQQVDGHDMKQLVEVLGASGHAGEAPRVVIARTVKGRGVSFMEGKPQWHHGVPGPEEAEKARQELQDALAALESSAGRPGPSVHPTTALQEMVGPPEDKMEAHRLSSEGN